MPIAKTKETKINERNGRFVSNELPLLLYILSPSYSGSTLLTFILARHRDIATVGELKASAIPDPATYHCSCGALLQVCSFWRTLQETIEQGGGKLDLSDFGTHLRRGPRCFKKVVSSICREAPFRTLGATFLKMAPPYRKRLGMILDQNSRLIQAITALQGGKVFLDGSKDPERLLHLVYGSRQKVKVIYLIRDGRGIANSFMKHNSVSMREAARSILNTQNCCERAIRHLEPNMILRVHYEDVCRDPSGASERILRYAGLDATTTTLNDRDKQFHILGNAMRLGSLDSIKVDEKWRKDLTVDDLEMFKRILGEQNERYGYS